MMGRESDIGPAYDLQAITIWMFLDVVSRIPILEIWRYDERFLVEYIRAEEFYKALVRGGYQLLRSCRELTENVWMSNLRPNLMTVKIYSNFAGIR
jgi:hypothetical protein